MERIKLTKTEKQVLRHVEEYGEKQPRDITPTMFQYCLSTLREKGMVEFKTNYDEVIKARLTIKGVAYIEQNPRLLNPIDWIPDLVLILSIMAAIVSVSCLLILILNR